MQVLVKKLLIDGCDFVKLQRSISCYLVGRHVARSSPRSVGTEAWPYCSVNRVVTKNFWLKFAIYFPKFVSEITRISTKCEDLGYPLLPPVNSHGVRLWAEHTRSAQCRYCRFFLNANSKTYQLPLETLTTDCLGPARSLLI